jgi:hypothetical protein
MTYFVIIDSLADNFFSGGTTRGHIFVVRLLLLSDESVPAYYNES